MIYVMAENLSGSVIRSQVLDMLALLHEWYGVQSDLLAMERHAQWRQSNRLRSLRAEMQQQGVRLHVFVHYGKFHPLTYLSLGLMLLTLVRLLVRAPRRHIVARNFHSACLAIPARRAFRGSRLILDLRGAFAHELALRGLIRPAGLLWKLLTWMEQRAFARSDHILCVSRRLARYVEDVLGHKAHISIVPSCVAPSFFQVDPDRARQVRRELGLGDRFVVVYAGSVTTWNLMQPMLDLFVDVRQMRSDAHFLCLTRDEDAARGAIAARGWSSDAYTVASVPHEQVKHYVAIGDIGLLLREDNLVNRVASPVKLGEYLACGVPVCITRYVGDLADIVAREGIGVAIDLNDSAGLRDVEAFVDDVARNRELYRRRCREWARAHLDRNAYRQVYAEIVG